MPLNETQKMIAHLMGVSDEQYLAAAGRRTAANANQPSSDTQSGPYPNAMRRISACDDQSDESDVEEMIARAKNHLYARDEDDHMDEDVRLVRAARCLMQALEMRSGGDTLRNASTGAHAMQPFVMSKIPGVRFVVG